MLNEKEVNQPNPLFMGAIGFILLLISVYIFTNFFHTRFPITARETADFFTQFPEVAKYSFASLFLNLPLATYAIFFSICFIAHFIIDKPKFRNATVYLIILNILFTIPFCVLPATKVQSFSLFHLVYFTFSLIPIIFLKKGNFHNPFSPYLIIFPILLYTTQYMAKKVHSYNTSNRGVIKHNIAKNIKASNTLPTPNPDVRRWIFISGKGFETSRLKVTLFSGFRCKECHKVQKILKALKKLYAGYMSVQFIPYPHSSKCNPSFQGFEEEFDCEIAKFSLCLNHKSFPQVYEMLMESGIDFSHETILNLARKAGKQDCFTSPIGDNLLTDQIKINETYDLKSSPMLLINGVSFRPPFDMRELQYYMDELMSRAL